MTAPGIGEGYRGPGGHTGYLLRQAWQTFRSAMDARLRAHGLTGAQYAALSVLARTPGLSGAELARACNTTPQAMNGVLATMERGGLIERHPHATHGRIRQVTLTPTGQAALDAATPTVRELEQTIEDGLTPAQLAATKAWLVTSAQRLEAIAALPRSDVRRP
jgi:DNA-binding MarR family transcriptional regulator